MSCRTENTLLKIGCERVSDLLQLNPDIIKSFGEKTRTEITEKISDIRSGKFVILSEEQQNTLRKNNLLLYNYFEKHDILVMESGLSTRSLSALCGSNIKKVSQLIKLSSEEIAKIKNMGSKSIEEVLQKREEIILPIIKKIEAGEITEEKC